MSVAATLTLPGQPASGTVVRTPLGGDGKTSPISADSFTVNLASDASAGSNSILVHTDPRFSCLTAHLQIRVASLAANINFQLMCAPTVTGLMQITGTIVDIGLTGVNPGVLWCPPGHIGSTDVTPSSGTAMFLLATIENTDTETLTFNALVFNFVKDVQQITPLPVLLASLPRGSSFT